MTKEEAIKLARAKLDILFKRTEVVIIEQYIKSFELGWKIPYQSKEYIEKGGFTFLIGTGPLIIDDEGIVYQTGSGMDPRTYLKDFIKYKKGDSYEENWSGMIV